AVARAVGPDFAGLGIVDDVLGRVAGPGDVLDPVLERHADRVDAGDELAGGTEHVERGFAHPGHDPHRDRDVGGVGDLDADFGDVGAEWAHREGHHVHRAALHAALEQFGERLTHLARVAPVVGRAGVD